MRRFICVMMVLVMMAVSATSALADGRGHRGGHGNHGSRGGVSDGTAILIGLSALVVGSAIASTLQQQQAPMQHQIAAPAYYAYQSNQYLMPPANHFIGECFPYGADFPGGVNVPGRGYFPPGMATPGFCFQ